MRLLMPVLVSLVFATVPAVAPPLSAQPLQSGWIADVRTGCRVWNAAAAPNESITWSGACSNGVAHGRGVLQWFQNGKPRDRNEGEYRDGRMNGRAVSTSPSGNRYEGEYRDGKPNGYGIFTTANGLRYEGEWRDGSQNGRGTSTSKNGDRYEGEWRDGKRSGQGVNLMANGNRYAGEFLDSRAHGLGTLVAPDGDVYKGTWTNGCFQQGNRRAVVGATAKECGFE